jgi:hypothetical protein
MRSFFRLVSIVWVPASVLFAQNPDPPKSDVKVVFAPDLTAHARTRPNGRAVPFEAPGGAVGIRLTDELAAGATVSVGEDGKVRLQCAPFRAQAEQAKAAKSAPPAGRKEFKHEK